MRVSSKAHYGLRMMTEFARTYGQGPHSLADVARDEHLPQPYLEQLAAQLRRGGLIESTRGVHGGYTQKDVTEVARAFTGWTIAKPDEGSGFVFRPRLHDIGPKTVLGVHFPAGGGIEEGETMIRFLAHNPTTAHRIASKLCQRLVADDPPATLVDRVAKAGAAMKLAAEAATAPKIALSERALCDVICIATGAYSPLEGFMGSADYNAVVEVIPV